MGVYVGLVQEILPLIYLYNKNLRIYIFIEKGSFLTDNGQSTTPDESQIDDWVSNILLSTKTCHISTNLNITTNVLLKPHHNVTICEGLGPESLEQPKNSQKREKNTYFRILSIPSQEFNLISAFSNTGMTRYFRSLS